MSKYASINPSSIPGSPEGGSNEFAALIQVKTSRYVKFEYNPDSNLPPKIGIKWTMGTTKGNTFERSWSIGVPWEGNENAISADGKHCTVAIKKNSDGFYLLEKAIEAGFPADKLLDDISVFEGETFFIATDVNPRAKGARRKEFPKRYHAEGWDAALAETLARRAAKEAQQNAPAYTPSSSATMQSSYNPPTIMATDVLDTVTAAAADALEAIVNGAAVTRNQIPKKLNEYVEGQQKATGRPWDPKFREAVAVALWDMNQLKSVVATKPGLTIDGETVSAR